MQPIGYNYSPGFPARLALVLSDPLDRLQWFESTEPAEVGGLFIEYWDALPPAPNRDDVRRLVVDARGPFGVPGVTMYDARLRNNIVEIRDIRHALIEF